jgi:hypothetical protein
MEVIANTLSLFYRRTITFSRLRLGGISIEVLKERLQNQWYINLVSCLPMDNRFARRERSLNQFWK